MNNCFCNHKHAAHELNGVCTIRGCKCIKYQALHYKNAPVAADFDRHRKSKMQQRELTVFGG